MTKSDKKKSQPAQDALKDVELSPDTDKCSIHWFRRDLRLADNPALVAACEHKKLVCVYIHDQSTGEWEEGGASKWWLHHSLESLNKSLGAHNTGLLVFQGKPKEILQTLCEELDAGAVYWNRQYEPRSVERDREIKLQLAEAGIFARSYNGALLAEPWENLKNDGKPYSVYTPYFNKFADFQVASPQAKPEVIHGMPQLPKKISSKVMDLDGLGLLPEISWDEGFADCWDVGEHVAYEKISKFLKKSVDDYDEARDVPSMQATSQMSPHLHFGEISPRQIWEAIRKAGGKPCHDLKGGKLTYAKEIVWREFAYSILFHNPETTDSPLNKKFENFPWKTSAKKLKVWQKGKTGYPIVDAGMRQLWTTGYMHNRVRMIVASFLVKHLQIGWQEGAKWFWDCLVDADLSSNSLGWQWAAGCGADAAPYFRIFNPILQGKKFDKKGEYVKQWCPELTELPSKYIHEPWEAPASVLAEAGVKLGKSYPKPIVDHKEAREAALDAYKEIK